MRVSANLAEAEVVEGSKSLVLLACRAHAAYWRLSVSSLMELLQEILIPYRKYSLCPATRSPGSP